MPYIKQEQRDSVDTCELHRSARYNSGPGVLNFSLTTVLLGYWDTSPQNYQAINDIIGALEGAKAEFYRRVVVPYENEKIKANGDVYCV